MYFSLQQVTKLGSSENKEEVAAMLSEPGEESYPQVVVIGPMKAGTTWLDSYLRSRGDICLPAGVKETFFFDRNCDKSLDWYLSHFRHYDPAIHKVIAEVSPSYFPEDQAALKIKRDLDDPKLIILVRDPVARAWSHYNHMRRYGYTRSGLEKAVLEHPEIVNASRYADRIAYWRSHFHDKSIFISSFDLLRENPEALCMQLCEFLQIPFIEPSQARKKLNASVEPRSLVVARSSRHVANYFRKYRFYFVVNAAKKLGLKQLAFGKQSAKPISPMTDEERRLLLSLLGDDIRELRRQVDIAPFKWYASYLQ